MKIKTYANTQLPIIIVDTSYLLLNKGNNSNYVVEKEVTKILNFFLGSFFLHGHKQNVKNRKYETELHLLLKSLRW